MQHKMWCCAVGQALLLCPVCVFVDGALQKDSRIPTLRGGPSAVAAPATWTDLLGARAERVPGCSSYLFRIPWGAADSRLSIHPRDPASLNANAVDKSTHSGGLEAVPLNASGRVDPSWWSWNFLPQRVTGLEKLELPAGDPM